MAAVLERALGLAEEHVYLASPGSHAHLNAV